MKILVINFYRLTYSGRMTVGNVQKLTRTKMVSSASAVFRSVDTSFMHVLEQKVYLLTNLTV